MLTSCEMPNCFGIRYIAKLRGWGEDLYQIASALIDNTYPKTSYFFC